MINIANPLYDVVFKYLLEDNESARILLSTLLGEEVLELELRPQEQVSDRAERSLTVMRLDFSAKIKTSADSSKLVIIEIQKAKLVTDIMRFRRYLGKQYMNPDNTYQGLKRQVKALPIVSIYFLAYELDALAPAVIRIQRTYLDASTQEQLSARHPFIESLTHDAVIVQVAKLHEPYLSELEKLLAIFDQHNKAAFGREVMLDEARFPKPFLRLKERLVRAIAEEPLRNQMDIEDDVLKELAEKERELEEKEQVLQANDKKLKEQDKKLEEQDRKLEETTTALVQTAQALHAKDQKLEE
ncbi:MAG: hypothetical protein ACKO6N_15040, partial [Myxococcota bacterium]